ncbi:MAG: peptidase, partial [Phenylobacterium sp.]|nr:peptidase [Phenylobacterium sp.]
MANRLKLCVIALAALLGAGPAEALDRAAWLRDLDQARAAVAGKYANLEWLARDRDVDVGRLFDQARRQIASSKSDADARAAFDRLVRGMGDGHVEIRWPAADPAADPPALPCAALGFGDRRIGKPLPAFAAGYRAIRGPEEFPAGLIRAGGRQVGVVRIDQFGPEPDPALCKAALQALAIPADRPCDDACERRMLAWLYGRLTQDFAATLRALRRAGAQTLVADLTGNGGGSEWAEAAARMVTPRRLTAERMGFVRSRHWTEKWARDAAVLRAAAGRETGHDRAFLLKAAQAYDARRTAAATRCDGEPLFRKGRPACRWVVRGFFATGFVGAADPSRFRGKAWAGRVFSPSKYAYAEGVWRGPLIVLVNGGTWSAAEEFAAELQDNRAAVIMG